MVLLHRRRKLHLLIRVLLLVLVAGWALVFYTAFMLNPYEDGVARRMETHRQLGLPACTFKEMTGYPCPSCGMTTSFALLMRADVWHSAQANFVGTLLATFGLVFIPWGIASTFAGRFVFVRSMDQLAFWLCMTFLVLLFGRWGLVVLLTYLAET